MPPTDVVFFADRDGLAPVLVWLDSLPIKVQNKCVAFVERLAQKGHELKRPECDDLRDDIFELRIGRRGINYRILYFFHDDCVVLSHGIIKQREVPVTEIYRAIANRDHV